MCDNTAPYTAQEVHLVTTKFKIVDKYTVEYKYITVLTQAQFLKKRKKERKISEDQSKPIWHPETHKCGGKKQKQNEIRQKHNESRANEGTEELNGWIGLKHLNINYGTRTALLSLSLSWEPDVLVLKKGKKQRIFFLQQLTGVPTSQLELHLYKCLWQLR